MPKASKILLKDASILDIYCPVVSDGISMSVIGTSESRFGSRMRHLERRTIPLGFRGLALLTLLIFLVEMDSIDPFGSQLSDFRATPWLIKHWPLTICCLLLRNCSRSLRRPTCETAWPRPPGGSRHADHTFFATPYLGSRFERPYSDLRELQNGERTETYVGNVQYSGR